MILSDICDPGLNNGMIIIVVNQKSFIINCHIMDYYFSTSLNVAFDEAVKLATEGLSREGFSVITEINLHDKFREKLGVDFKKYRILGACNPGYAHEAIGVEDKIGVMLPCNVLVIEQGEGNIEIAAVNPVVSMMGISNPVLAEVAGPVTMKLKNVIASLAEVGHTVK
jgi:uncharacterized protein (DUF302 family)